MVLHHRLRRPPAAPAALRQAGVFRYAVVSATNVMRRTGTCRTAAQHICRASLPRGPNCSLLHTYRKTAEACSKT